MGGALPHTEAFLSFLPSTYGYSTALFQSRLPLPLLLSFCVSSREYCFFPPGVSRGCVPMAWILDDLKSFCRFLPLLDKNGREKKETYNEAHTKTKQNIFVLIWKEKRKKTTHEQVLGSPYLNKGHHGVSRKAGRRQGIGNATEGKCEWRLDQCYPRHFHSLSEGWPIEYSIVQCRIEQDMILFSFLEEHPDHISSKGISQNINRLKFRALRNCSLARWARFQNCFT